MRKNIEMRKVAVHLKNGAPWEYLYVVDADRLLEQYSGDNGFDAASLISDVRAAADKYEQDGCKSEEVPVLRVLADSVEMYNEIPIFISIRV